MDRWVGKVAVVTGASSGIGAVIAQRLVKAGILVVGLGRRYENLQALSAIEGFKGKLYPRRCDVTNEENLRSTFEWVSTELGGVDILVNNAGAASCRRILDDDTAALRKTLDVNVLATAVCLREAVASMKSRDVPGYIININSILGHALPNFKVPVSLYPASKHALTALTESVRRELSAEPNNKIKITSISPGLVKTDIHKSAGLIDNSFIFNAAPYLEPEDVADAVLYVLGTRDKVQVAELMIRPLGEP